MTDKTINYPKYFHEASTYGFQEYFDIIGELSQQSAKKGQLSRLQKELITLGIALHKDCQRCVDIHKLSAIKLGAGNKDQSLVNNVVLFLFASPGHESLLWQDWEKSWKKFSYSKKTEKYQLREMIALAISVVKQDHAQIDLHLHSALSIGVTIEQVFEIIPLVLLMDGAPTLSQIPTLFNSYHTYLERQTPSA